jgi:hypothetical protein
VNGLGGATWRPELLGGLLWLPLLKKGGKEMLAVIYTFSVSVAAAFLFAAVNQFEPDRLLALALKFVIVFVSCGGRRETDALIGGWGCCPGLKVLGELR